MVCQKMSYIVIPCQKFSFPVKSCRILSIPCQILSLVDVSLSYIEYSVTLVYRVYLNAPSRKARIFSDRKLQNIQNIDLVINSF